MNRTVNNERGQLLIPGLAVYFGLTLLFAGLIIFGKRALTQTRMDMAAEAAALSAARSQAKILSDCSMYNWKLQPFLPLTYKGFAAAPLSSRNSLESFFEIESMGSLYKFKNAGMRGYPIAVGRAVARENGSTATAFWPVDMNPFLNAPDMTVFFVFDFPPFVIWKTYENAYFERLWKPDIRAAQPIHKTSWITMREGVYGTASARVYLDEQKDTPLNNGGFPRTSESLLEDVELQSFYPQFNAEPVPTTVSATLLKSLLGASDAL